MSAERDQKSGVDDFFELTQSQLLLWTGQKLNSAAPLYNMVLTFEFSAPINTRIFKEAFHLLVNKSDTLRIVFQERDGIPVQKILPVFDPDLEMLDWSDRSNPEADYKNWLKTRSQINFDLSKVLFDSVLIKISEERFVWYLNQHHLITDAWAVSVLYKNMAALYDSLLKGETVTSEPFPEFRSYVAFEKQNRLNPAQSPIHSYWEEKLKMLPTAPRLYGFSKRDTTSRARRIYLDIGLERSTQLRAIALEKGIRSWTLHLSLFNIFSTLLFAFLYRISGQQKLSIGTPSHNRPTPVFKETAGVFIEVFPLMVELEEDLSFRALLKKVQAETNAFLRYAQPGAGKPGLSRSFNVVLNYINAAFSDFNDLPMKSEWVHPDHIDLHHHLRLQVYDFDVSGNIHLYFDLNEDVFDESLRQSVPAHFLNLLDAFIEDRDIQIQAPQLITADEFEKSVVQFNQNQWTLSESENLLQQFESQAKKSPDSLALSFENHSLTYLQLDEQSNQIAHYLQKSGISKGSRVALYLERSPELIAAILGTLKVGACFVPIAANYPSGRVAYMLEDVQAGILLTTNKLKAPLGHLAFRSINLDTDWQKIAQEVRQKPDIASGPDDLAYIMYTSGSTGDPKGVMISHQAIANYIQFAKEKYVTTPTPVLPLFTMIGFDLTITSVFLPLVSGGSIKIYGENSDQVDLSILQVIEDNAVDIIKVTPSHLKLIKDENLKASRIKTMIVGGEAFKPDLAKDIHNAFPSDLTIYNEYGPTEASVGCVVHQYDPEAANKYTVPIGKPIPNMEAYVLDTHQNPAPTGVLGELYISGKGLANGYWNKKQLSEAFFIPNPFQPGTKMYRTGDFVRFNQAGELEYSGRKDHQVKIGGIRIELAEIEAAMQKQTEVEQCVVLTHTPKAKQPDQIVTSCVQCGLPSNYPDSEFDEKGICNLCNAFESYQKKASKYFKNTAELQTTFAPIKETNKGDYDCMMLLSGGKDSTYALGQLIDMGLRVLAFTLDNGYISPQAKDNIKRVVKQLGVDHVFGSTPAMNEIFVDSLKRHSNVCNGCFKTLYTLSTKIALEKNIPYIVTGLSRGQFFETRLTEELFWKEEVDIERIDEIILNARKSYHRVEDAISQLLDVSIFDDDQVFEKVKFLDFYRYSDVSMEDMMAYLDDHLPWERPTDTGRSTNCLINQVGIYVHKKEQGYSNYAFPYSWDVRLGHKEREAALEEINEEINIDEVHQIMAEIGYVENEEHRTDDDTYLVAYYKGTKKEKADFKKQLATSLPNYMIPVYFKHLPEFPLSSNGKIDRLALLETDIRQLDIETPYVAPGNEIEELLAQIWSEVLKIQNIGIHYKFLDLGGNSLKAIRLIARKNEAFDLDLPLNRVFEFPTIASFAIHIEETIKELLGESFVG